MRHRELHSNCMLSHVCGRASPGLGNNLCDNRLMGKRRLEWGSGTASGRQPRPGGGVFGTLLTEWMLRTCKRNVNVQPCAWMDQPRFSSPVRALHARVVRHRV